MKIKQNKKCQNYFNYLFIRFTKVIVINFINQWLYGTKDFAISIWLSVNSSISISWSTELYKSLKNGCAKAPFTLILFDGSSCIIWVMRSRASGSLWKLVHNFTRFSFPFTFHLGYVIFISGRSGDPYHNSSFGVPRHLKILNIWPISLSP